MLARDLIRQGHLYTQTLSKLLADCAIYGIISIDDY